MSEIVVSLHWLDWVIIVGYIGFIIWVGFYFSRRAKNFDDYFMAGRSLPAPLLVATLVSTFYGLDTFFEEVAYWEGISAFFAYSLPYTLLYIVMAFLAPKFKDKFPSGTTMQEITKNAYGPVAGIVASISAFVYSTNTIEMLAVGVVLKLVTGWPLWIGVLIAAVLITVYTWFGGLWAVTMTDFFQFVILMVCLGLAMLIGWNSIGGFETVNEGILAFVEFMEYEEPYAESASYFFKPGAGYLTGWSLVAYSITALTILCEPAFFQRIFAAKDSKGIRRAFGVGVPMWLAFDWITTFLGILAAAMVGLEILPELMGKEATFAASCYYLPIGLTGLFVAGVLAIAMSTADSYFLVSGGVVGYDIYKGYIKPDATDDEVKKKTRMGILISAAISVVMAFLIETIIGLWVFQATFILTVTLVPVYFATFAKKKPKPIAGIVSSIVGLAFSILWYASFIGFGYYDEDSEIVILEIFGLELWQDYGIIIGLPLVFIIFVLFNTFGKDKEAR